MEGQAGAFQGPEQRLVPRGRRLQHDERLVFGAPGDQGGDPARIVVEAPRAAGGVKMGVETLAGHVDPQRGLRYGHGSLPCPAGLALQRRPRQLFGWMTKGGRRTRLGHGLQGPRMTRCAARQSASPIRTGRQQTRMTEKKMG